MIYDGMDGEYIVIGRVLASANELKNEDGLKMLTYDAGGDLINEIKRNVIWAAKKSPFGELCQGEPKLIIFTHYF